MMDGYSFYVVDVEEWNLLVMDPTETSVHNDKMKLKHEGNTQWHVMISVLLAQVSYCFSCF